MFDFIFKSLSHSLKGFVIFHTIQELGFNISLELNIICSETHQRVDHNLKAVLCMLDGGLLATKKGGKMHRMI